jgi:hypothetical protein
VAARKQKAAARRPSAASEGALLERVRKAVARKRDVTEKRMFGGITFLLHGNMACGVTKGGVDLMVRVGPDAHADALALEHARPMDITGRPMKGFVFVAAAGSRTPAQVSAWVERGLAFARTLPAK